MRKIPKALGSRWTHGDITIGSKSLIVLVQQTQQGWYARTGTAKGFAQVGPFPKQDIAETELSQFVRSLVDTYN